MFTNPRPLRYSIYRRIFVPVLLFFRRINLPGHPVRSARATVPLYSLSTAYGIVCGPALSFIQGDSGGKVNILGSDVIGDVVRKKISHEHCV
jgi:hypothetical protein